MAGMTLFHRRPTGMVDDFRREFDTLFRQFFEGGDGSAWSGMGMFHPQANIAETETGYEVTLDLPGMKAEDFNIELQQGHLVVSGERCEESESDDKTWHRKECSVGTFRRMLPLDSPVDADKIDAVYRDGVLKVTVPKTEEARPKKISVHRPSVSQKASLECQSKGVRVSGKSFVPGASR